MPENVYNTAEVDTIINALNGAIVTLEDTVIELDARLFVLEQAPAPEPEPQPEPQPEPEPIPSGFHYGPGPFWAVPVPVGAIPVNVNNIAANITNNPAGTNFALADGVYPLEGLPNKDNNQYYGNPADHEAVRFEGGATYASLTDGSQPTGGRQYVMKVEPGNGFFNMTFDGYRCYQDKFGPLRMSGSFGCTFQNVEFRHMFAHGINASGRDHVFRGVSSWGNGSMSVKARDLHNGLFEGCDFYSSGDDTMKALGRTPKIAVSDRGICKITSSNGVLLKDSHVHDIKGFTNGWWADGNCNDFDVDNCLFEDMDRFAIQHELTHGGKIMNSTFVACGNIEDTQFNYSHAAIGLAISGVVVIENNVIDGGPNKETWNGIMVYAPNPATRPYVVPDSVWSPMCGTIIRNNTFSNLRGFNIASHCNVTRDGCNFHDDPSQIIIENNSYDSNVEFWEKGPKTAAQWAGYGYS